MPIYEYECKVCNENFSLLQSINSKAEDIKCPNCNSQNVSKKISSFSCCLVGQTGGYDSTGLHASHATG